MAGFKSVPSNVADVYATLAPPRVNFANRFLGIGAPRGRYTEEEILSYIRPEILIGMLFFEAMEDNEALVIEGAERFSRYTDSRKKFKWAGDFSEAEDAKNLRDSEDRWRGAVVAIDALPFSESKPQFEIESIRRGLTKAYCGFCNHLAPYRVLPNVVVSGNWGCGTFRGNKELKCLIQMMACAQAGKSLAYCTFSDEEFAKRALQVFETLCSNSCTVGQLWRILVAPHVLEQSNRELSVFDLVLEKLSNANVPSSPL
ncbi:hypothetical protein Aperf_G00000015985 [Anoplocephala perfoliata]